MTKGIDSESVVHWIRRNVLHDGALTVCGWYATWTSWGASHLFDVEKEMIRHAENQTVNCLRCIAVPWS